MIELADATRAARSVIPILRAEGAAALTGALVAYHHLGSGWIAFAALFLAPDLSMLAYLVDGRFGARVYNCAHTYLTPAALAGVGWFGGLPWLCAGALIWIAHIGFDRALGFGLKRSRTFRDTHLSTTGTDDGGSL